MTTLFQIQGDITDVRSRAKGAIRIVFESLEDRTEEQRAKAMAMHEKHGWFTFSVEPIKPEQLINLPPLTYEKDEKSPSQRLRASLYILWEQKGKPTDTFSAFYDQQMERFINAVQEKLT